MTEIVSFHNIDDFRPVARDFQELLSNKSNGDISLDFPSTLQRYSGPQSLAELEKSAANCVQGEREQFIVFHEGRAVGLSAVQRVHGNPPEIPEDYSANLSGFICRPYRGVGLGKASLVYRLGIVDDRFEGKAYTRIRQENEASRKMVEKLGLTAVLIESNFIHYLYNGEKPTGL